MTRLEAVGEVTITAQGGVISRDMDCPHCGGVIGVNMRIAPLPTPQRPAPKAPGDATAKRKRK